MAFPALSVLAARYKVFCIVDASGNWSKMATDLTIARIAQPADDLSFVGQPYFGLSTRCELLDQAAGNGHQRLGRKSHRPRASMLSLLKVTKRAAIGASSSRSGRMISWEPSHSSDLW